MSEHERVPLPWRVVVDPQHPGIVEGIYGPTDAYQQRVVETDLGVYPPDIEDAKLIVEAVNEHALLRRVAEAAEVWIGTNLEDFGNGKLPARYNALIASVAAWKKSQKS